MSEQPGMGAAALHARTPTHIHAHVYFTDFIANFKLIIVIITKTDDAVCLSPKTNIPLIKVVTLADDAVLSLIFRQIVRHRSERSIFCALYSF